MIFFVTKTTNKICIPQSLRKHQTILFYYHEYLLHLGQTKIEKTIRNTMTWLGLTQDDEHSFYMFHLSSMSNDKDRKEHKLKMSNDNDEATKQEIWAATTQNSTI
jgi:hypothetical protein